MERTRKIRLTTPIESNDGVERYEEINLKEPVLIQVEQFYAEQAKSTSSLPAMRLLIVLVSGIPDALIKKMSITDFAVCRDYLQGFLEFKPSANGNS
ncbi:phage tail assembly protein [Providencia rettgeri]|nr:phage tail assembly protein [Providencia stuartii]MBS0861366.1 phage tail assembly protein [Providencia rettgeri]ELR5082448.1 phage tail assembly protein [Providencia stuartii]MBS0875189.1 phage tail assembly protein [Providencia rettgeri]MBS0921491.1 phage tail assembly protein [Providencia rettgeri]